MEFAVPTLARSAQVRETAEQSIRRVFAGDPVLIDIAECESHFTQFNPDGSVHRGVQNHKDIGVFQINEYWNGAMAKRLGYDIYTAAGNIAMAKWLYKHQGTAPWSWSSWCWSDG